jgi:hypothetical protein
MKKQIDVHPAAGVRHDARTGQYVPTHNGKDIPVTTFDEERAWSIADQQAKTGTWR